MTLIKTTIKNHVLLIELNRTEKMNAFTSEMLEQLADAYTSMENDENVRCGLVFSKGEHFTAGLDLADVGKQVAMGKKPFSKDKVGPLQIFGQKRTKPVVFAVQGYCLTIAIELMLAADICIAAKSAKFGQIEIKRGIFPFGGATIRFMQRAGWGNAMRYLLTGDMFDADEAFRMGLVQEVVEGNPFDKAFEIANTIATQAPLGVYATLENAQLALKEGEDAAKAALMETLLKLMKSEDAKEGMLSFVERRKAEFKGK